MNSARLRLAAHALRALALALLTACAGASDEPVRMGEVTLRAGELTAVVLDNARSPELLSGIDSLFHSAAPGFDAFDPDAPGLSAGLNFEHLMSDYRDSANRFAPRRGRMRMFARPAAAEAVLVREAADSPWGVASQISYRLVAPHYVDFEFRCHPTVTRWFDAEREVEGGGYAAFFFASYMNDALEPHINFPGVTTAGDPPLAGPRWVRVDAPEGHPDWDGGGTYRAVGAAPLAYDEDHNTEHNLWSYDDPRIAEPFYFGRLAHGMVWAVMFDRLVTDDDEIRFSLFKYKLPQAMRPAWDFQYVIRRVRSDRVYGFRARAVFKPFAGPEDIRAEYESWRASLDAGPTPDARQPAGDVRGAAGTGPASDPATR